MASEEATVVDATMPVVTFRLAEQRYALPLEAVLQVVRLPDLTIVAGTPPSVCGLLNLRGQFLPVLNGRALVDAELMCQLDSCILVLAHNGQPALGLLTDEVEAVRAVSSGDLTTVAQSADFIAGVLRDGEGSAILLDAAVLHVMATGA